MNCQGTHLIADLYGCRNLDDAGLVDAVLRDATSAVGATLVGLHLHRFGDGQGVTGVAMLAESHISIHTWPEHDYAAVDMFVCGAGHDLDAGLRVMIDRFQAAQHDIKRLDRGIRMQVDVPSQRRPADSMR